MPETVYSVTDPRKPATEVVFPDNPPPNHLFDRRCVYFPARVDGEPVVCLVSEELLWQQFGVREWTEEAMMAGYQQHQDAIQSIARSHIEWGWISPENEVVLTSHATRLTVRFGQGLRYGSEEKRLAEQAMRQLARLIGPNAGEVKVEWDGAEGPRSRELISLRLSDATGVVTGVFERRELEPSSHLRLRLARIWGDLLQIRSNKQLQQLLS